MRAEDLKKVILRMSGSGEFYGYKIHKQRGSKKIEVSTSRLYRTLAEMVRQGFLKSRWQKGQLGPRQRVYELGEKGSKEREKILLDAIATVHGFSSDYLLNLPAQASVFNARAYVDLLVIVGVPYERSLEKSLKEWRRVLKHGGRLAICVPTVFMHRYDDPLSIGNFIEKYEHKTLEESQHIEADKVKALLRKSFNKVEEQQIVHITVFLACNQH